MRGNDRIRFCKECNLNVYNFSAMTLVEIEDLTLHREGRLCARLYQRSDGKVLTKNCPVGFRASLVRATGFASATLSTLLSIIPATSGAQAQQKTEAPTRTHTLPVSISMEITDITGRVISGAEIAVKDEATGKEWDLKTNDAGYANISNLPKALYEIAIVSPGFKIKTLRHVAVPNADLQRVQLDVASTMGVVVTVGELVPERQNPIKKLFSKVRRII